MKNNNNDASSTREILINEYKALKPDDPKRKVFILTFKQALILLNGEDCKEELRQIIDEFEQEGHEISEKNEQSFQDSLLQSLQKKLESKQKKELQQIIDEFEQKGHEISEKNEHYFQKSLLQSFQNDPKIKNIKEEKEHILKTLESRQKEEKKKNIAELTGHINSAIDPVLFPPNKSSGISRNDPKIKKAKEEILKILTQEVNSTLAYDAIKKYFLDLKDKHFPAATVKKILDKLQNTSSLKNDEFHKKTYEIIEFLHARENISKDSTGYKNLIERISKAVNENQLKDIVKLNINVVEDLKDKQKQDLFKLVGLKSEDWEKLEKKFELCELKEKDNDGGNKEEKKKTSEQDNKVKDQGIVEVEMNSAYEFNEVNQDNNNPEVKLADPHSTFDNCD